jgi:hypothetical protein
MRQDDIICIDNLDTDRAAYYKNNILHFFALPAILSYVLTNVHNGHIEELHRCFDHMFAKLQATYFLPGVESTHGFIDSFLRILAQRGLIVVSDSQWAINKQKSNSTLLRVMSRLGSELVQGDLPNLLDTIRRSSSRKDVRVASRLTSLETTTHVQAKASGLSTTEFYVQCEGTVLPGDHVEFEPNDFDTMLSGSVVRVDADGAAVRHGQLDPEEFDRWKSTGSAQFLEGRATIKREQSGSGFITNLSPDGAFVTTSLRLKVGNLLTCSLGQQDNAFILHGRVARVTETGVGVYFEKLSEESKARIVLLSVDSSVFSK